MTTRDPISKTLMEMTPQELREEIGRLMTELNKVHDKNKRRRKALKDINRSVLLKNTDIAAATRTNWRLSTTISDLRDRLELLETKLKEHDEAPRVKGLLSLIFPRGTRGTSGA